MDFGKISDIIGIIILCVAVSLGIIVVTTLLYMAVTSILGG